MSALAIGGIVFGCVFGGAMLGMVLGATLPKHHLSNDSKDVIKIAVALIATLSALVLGLLIASAKSSFDDKDIETRRGAARAILLDRTMAEYGPETRQIRDRLREILAMRIARIWPDEDQHKVAPQAIGQGQQPKQFRDSFWIFPRKTMLNGGSSRRRCRSPTKWREHVGWYLNIREALFNGRS
jgi:hypothetical protein